MNQGMPMMPGPNPMLGQGTNQSMANDPTDITKVWQNNSQQ